MTLRLPGRWDELTSREFAALDPQRTVAILPVGAIEQHGPHLPVAVDTCLNEAIVRRGLELMPAGLPVLVLPTVAVGKSNEHLDFPGTLTLSAETLGRVWYEIGASVRRAGVRKLLLFNSHGGQPQVTQIVARELRIDHAMLAVAANWYSWGLPDGLFDTVEVRHGIHAGEIETSMMLAVRPELVDLAAAADFVPVTVADDVEFPRLRALGAAGLGWLVQDLHGEGACGDATRATAAAGHAVIEHAAGCLVELVQELVQFPLHRLRARPQA
ncbi:MAG: creatininase family protein [Geminicoccaceae bacterium]